MTGPRRMLACLALVLVTAGGLAAPSAAAPLPELVRVVVDQSYEYRRPSLVTYEPLEGIELAVSDLVEDMLYAAGTDVLLEGDEGGPEATIRITVRGRAIGGSYLEPVRAYLYTGAEIRGEIVIERPGQPALTRSFFSDIQRPFRIAFNLGYEDPANAPYDDTLRQPGGFVRVLAAVVAEAWGLEAVTPSLFEADPALRYNVAGLLGDIGDASVVPDLVETLGDENARVRWEAAWSLGRIGDPVAIPDLIGALSDEAEDVRWFASWSLRTITGADYGADAEVWQAWYEENGEDAGS